MAQAQASREEVFSRLKNCFPGKLPGKEKFQVQKTLPGKNGLQGSERKLGL